MLGQLSQRALATLLDGHERAMRHFGGVTCLYDNLRTLMLGRRDSAGRRLTERAETKRNQPNAKSQRRI